MPKQKPHKGLLKRARITATGKVKFHKPGKNHINSHMDGTTLRNKRRTVIAKKGDIKLLQRLVAGKRLRPAE